MENKKKTNTSMANLLFFSPQGVQLALCVLFLLHMFTCSFSLYLSEGRFLSLCGRTSESCEGGWDTIYAGTSLSHLPGKKHKEGGKRETGLKNRIQS